MRALPPTARMRPGAPETVANRETCVDAAELAEMLDGALPPERAERVLAHIDNCETCSDVVGVLGHIDHATTELGRYELGNVLGAGAMGIVYEAWDPKLRRRVALKVVRPERVDDEATERSLREARALARVNHPNVVTVYDVTELDGQICVATELVDGETLATWQRDRGRDEVVGAWLQAARGLAAAHAVGVIHRDVKPANVLIDREGRVRVGDFGLARFGREPAPLGKLARGTPADHTFMTATGTVAGTPAYMSPEQANGEADARSDQYSLCVAFAEGLTHTLSKPGTVPAIDGALRDVLARGLRVEPAERFPSMEALIEAIVVATRPRRRRWPYVAAAAALVGAIATVVIASARSHDSCVVEPLPPAAWPAERRAAIARDHGEPLANHVDRWFVTWRGVATEICQRAPSPAIARAQRACLHDMLARYEAKLSKLTPGLDRFAAWSLVEDVVRPSRCAAGLVAPEPTPAAAASIAPLRAELYAGEMSVDAHEAMFATAKTIDYVPFTIDVALALSEALYATNTARSIAVLREGEALARARGSELARALIANALIRRLPAGSLTEVKQLAEQNRTRVATLGDRELEGDFEYAYAMALYDNHSLIEASAGLHRAIAAYRVVFGRDCLHVALLSQLVSSIYLALDRSGGDYDEPWQTAASIYTNLGLDALTLVDARPTADPRRQIEQLSAILAQQKPGTRNVAGIEGSLGAVYLLASDPSNAVVHYERALTVYDQLGVHHDMVLVQLLVSLAGIQNNRHESARALQSATRALVEAEPYPRSTTTALALIEQARAHSDLGDLAAARAALESATEIEGQLPRHRAYMLDLLAHVTWPIDRKRARTLAQSALLEYEVAIKGLDNNLTGDRVYGPRIVEHQQQLEAWLAAQNKRTR